MKHIEEIKQFNKEQEIMNEFEKRFGKKEFKLDIARAIHLTLEMNAKKGIGE